MKINLWKTVYFNFHYFPFKTAMRMPAFIYKRTLLYKMGGEDINRSTCQNGYDEVWTAWIRYAGFIVLKNYVAIEWYFGY